MSVFKSYLAYLFITPACPGFEDPIKKKDGSTVKKATNKQIQRIYVPCQDFFTEIRNHLKITRYILSTYVDSNKTKCGKSDKYNLRIISKPHAHLQTMTISIRGSSNKEWDFFNRNKTNKVK